MNKTNPPPHVIGIDYGTDSCRIIIVDVSNGHERAAAVAYYKRWAQGLYCDKTINQYRQHPLDYIEALQDAMQQALAQAGEAVVASIVGMSFDTTGSTPALIDEKGMPLALQKEFCEEPDAMFILWKDHSAIEEAEHINQVAHRSQPDYTAYSGGIYSAEWAWSKVLHISRCNDKVYQAAHSWCEHCDWMSALMTGQCEPLKIKRSRCAAGHKAMWHESWGGTPPQYFMEAVDPKLVKFLPSFTSESHTSDSPAGFMCEEWKEKLGLRACGDIIISVGILDAHAGAVGAQVAPKVLTRIMGTSTCDIIVCPKEELKDKCVRGICGQVDGSVLPGLIGLEAGQSAFGDIYAWFKNILSWGLEQVESEAAQKLQDKVLERLEKEAALLDINAEDPLSIDWFNGRRTPDANQRLKGAIFQLTLGSSAPMIYKALVEGTAFGTKAIIERFREEGVDIESIIAIGGIAHKSDFVMQSLADVLNMPIKVNKSTQSCALGAAMFAALAAGCYNNMAQAQEKMGLGFSKEYLPNPSRTDIYEKRYRVYCELSKKIEL